MTVYVSPRELADHVPGISQGQIREMAKQGLVPFIGNVKVKIPLEEGIKAVTAAAKRNAREKRQASRIPVIPRLPTVPDDGGKRYDTARALFGKQIRPKGVPKSKRQSKGGETCS